jgi:hypothetical protein
MILPVLLDEGQPATVSRGHKKKESGNTLLT